MSTLPTCWAEPRSTCHHPCGSPLVCETEPWNQSPSVLPSTARLAGESHPVVDCVATFPSAKLVSPASGCGANKAEKNVLGVRTFGLARRVVERAKINSAARDKVIV